MIPLHSLYPSYALRGQKISGQELQGSCSQQTKIAIRRLIDELDVFRVDDRAVMLVGPTREICDYGIFRFYYEEWVEAK